MGANIKGVGTDVIRIEGTDELKGCKHTIIPDRIEAGTYTIMAAAKGGEVIIDNVIPTHLESLTAKLREMGVEIEAEDERLIVRGNRPFHSCDIQDARLSRISDGSATAAYDIINPSGRNECCDRYDLQRAF